MKKSVKFAVIADPHYYSEKLGNSGIAYTMRANSDQKMLAHSKGVISAALEEIKNSDAEFLLIAGDLSNDGERVSHEEMRHFLYEFKKHKPVYIITATHDWCCDGNPRRFEGAKVYHDVETLKPEELRDFYKDFGPDDAVSEFFTHQKKSSYVIRPAENVSVFCLDDDQDGQGNSGYSKEHFTWIKEELENARKRGDFVFGMQHHHMLLTEFDRIINSKSSVERKEKLSKEFADAGLSVMFTGHSHMHHIRRVDTENNNHFYEFNVASIGGYPAPIVYCTLTENGIETKTKHLEKYEYNGKTYTNDHLKNHATFLFENVFEAAKNNRKLEFVTLLVSIGISNKKAKNLWLFLGNLIKAISEISVYKTARIINFFTFGKAFTISEAKKLKNVRLTSVIFELFHSILDGSVVKHERTSPYYIIVTQALSLPLRIVRKLHIKNSNLLRILTHLENAADEILTGDPIDANNAFLEF
ncbi:MAG: metallophosphoesterase [Clostridia bacterium]|nr:metallophosphoesterase [Clostridia bacterium]